MNVKNILEKITITPLLDTLRLQKIDDAVYFSEKYSDYISNSRLGLLNSKNGGSCQKFLDGLAANNQFNQSFQLGSAVHECVLQPEYFYLVPELDKPSAKAGVMADIIYNYEDHQITSERLQEAAIKADYYHGMPSAKQLLSVSDKIRPYLQKRSEFDLNNSDDRIPIYLDNNSRQTALGCIEALSKNQEVQNLLHPVGIVDDVISENEQAILLDCEVNGPGIEKFIIRLKAKLDNYTISKEDNLIIVNDVKTSRKEPQYFKDAIESFSYYREMAVYCFLLKQVVTKYYDMKDPKVKSNFLVVKTFEPFETGVVEMTDELFKKGTMHFKYLLRLAAIALFFKDSNKYDEYINKL